ncbi:MAG: hypothetical protein M1827_002684 [Pycnora praestabilis]|nr:MAG: hypothetical protein M1827_002684 [Pycnora praestabilis]
MLFSALYGTLPSANRSLQKGGFSSQAAAYMTIGLFIAGVIGIQVLSRFLHHYIPSHVMECDHTHEEEDPERTEEGLQVENEHPKKPHHSEQDHNHVHTRKEPTHSHNHGSSDENTPLLSPERYRNRRETAPSETTQRHGAPSISGFPSRRPSLQARLTSLVSGSKASCGEGGPCYGYSEPCGLECFKAIQWQPSAIGGTPRSRHPSLQRRATASMASFSGYNHTPLEGLDEEAALGAWKTKMRDLSEESTLSGSYSRSESGSYRSPNASLPANNGKDNVEGEAHKHAPSTTAPPPNDPLQSHHHHVPTNAFLSIGLQTSIAIALHKLPEGFITFATNHANPKLGFAVFLALLIHNLTEGFAMALPLYLALGSRWKAMFWSSLLGGISQPLGAGVAAIWFKVAGRSDMAPGQGLKPGCVELSQVVLQFSGKKSSGKDVVSSLEGLLRILTEVATTGTAFDEKLADYTFFPLSHIFRESQRLPVRALELALQCLLIILKRGWRYQMAINLAKQLLILLSFLAGGSRDSTQKQEPSEELKILAFDCLSSLFSSLGSFDEGKGFLTETSNVPVLGHAVSVVLEGLTDGTSNGVQLSALEALETLTSCVLDREALASFFPGIVSALTKTLQPTTQSRRSYRILEGGLKALNQVLRDVLEDTTTRSIQSNLAENKIPSTHTESPLDNSWLKATSAQVKLALANIVKLRDHDRMEVRQSLFDLCLTVLEHCRVSLSESVVMMVETLVSLSGSDGHDLDGNSSLKHIASADLNVAESLKTSLLNWVVALPRVMQSNDDAARRRLIGQISTTFHILTDLGVDLGMVDSTLAVNVRDSVAAAIHISSEHASISERPHENGSTLELISAGEKGLSKEFGPVLMGHRSQQDTLRNLSVLVKQLSTSGSSLVMAKGMLDRIRDAAGDELLANFWLSLNVLKEISASNFDIEDWLDLGPSPLARLELLGELYSIALSTLVDTPPTSIANWRLQGLALETIAVQAQQLKKDFRSELVDALYPVVHLLGAPQPQLRNHAITCLNIISEACDYHNPRDLIFDNVDYLVNAVALKLNTFDISPQAPQVLLMMIKISGPSLLPYLDDLVGSVFAALDWFHGYPLLVELLFSVLEGIVDEGSKTQLLAMTDGSEIVHQKPPYKPHNVAYVCTILKQANTKALERSDDNSISRRIATFPRQPWTATGTLSEKVDPAEGEEEEEEEEEEEGNSDVGREGEGLSEETSPPPNKTYTMIQSIARLGQHYLTHSSPTLRRQLLHLTSTACSSLQNNENEFLPLVNDVWPVVSKRLYDDEPFVIIAATEAISQICRSAGDFVSSRIEAEWLDLKALYWVVERKMRTETKGKGARGIYTSNYQTWEALLQLLITILGYVRIDDDIADDILEMMSEWLSTRNDLRGALEGLNPDAVWGEMEKRKSLSRISQTTPRLEGFAFRSNIW